MASRRSKGSPITIDKLDKMRAEAIKQLKSTKEQEKGILERIDKIDMLIKNLRPNAFDVLPEDVFKLIGNRLGAREYVNLRATANSIRSRLPISPTKQGALEEAESEHNAAAIEIKLGSALGDIVKEQKKINHANQERRVLNSKNRADLKNLDAVARRGMQSLLQPGIRAQRAARRDSVSPRFELLLSSPKKSSR